MLEKKEMTLETAQMFFEASLRALDAGSPIKTPLFKTLEGLQEILGNEAKELRVLLDKMVESYDEENKPILKEGYSLSDYEQAINDSRTKICTVEIHKVKESEKYILPTGERISIGNFLEKSIAIPSKTFATLKEYYLYN